MKNLIVIKLKKIINLKTIGEEDKNQKKKKKIISNFKKNLKNFLHFSETT